ncbi:MAG TPA: aldo/keto reductase [Candidatus Bathyarchaeia archaeon]|nr:aldo/keto reductase [Candidatus Bathyarchaeia archaeon]
MEKINFGKTNLKVSRIGLGTLAFGHPSKGIQDKETIYDCLNFALDRGINLIDTAEEYSRGMTEKFIGEVLKERGDREDMVIVTKVSHNHLSYKNVIRAANNSLERLQTNYIDLYLIHWPWAYSPISETAKAMDQLLAEGKIRYVGVSNYNNALVQELMDNLQNGQVIANEIEYNLIKRDVEKEMLPFLRKQKIVALTYYPLLSGFLTTNYDENAQFPEKDFRNFYELFKNKENFTLSKELFETLKQIAKNHDVSPSEVAINWLLKDDDIIPIPGAKKRSHIESNIHATEWKLTKDEISQLSAMTDNLELNWNWW